MSYSIQRTRLFSILILCALPLSVPSIGAQGKGITNGTAGCGGTQPKLSSAFSPIINGSANNQEDNVSILVNHPYDIRCTTTFLGRDEKDHGYFLTAAHCLAPTNEPCKKTGTLPRHIACDESTGLQYSTSYDILMSRKYDVAQAQPLQKETPPPRPDSDALKVNGTHNVFIHPEYVASDWFARYDLALLRTRSVPPHYTGLPIVDPILYPGKSLKIIGYGARIHLQGTFSEQQRHSGEVAVESVTDTLFTHIFDSSNDTVSVSSGDSGGPAVIDIHTGKQKLQAIVGVAAYVELDDETNLERGKGVHWRLDIPWITRVAKDAVTVLENFNHQIVLNNGSTLKGPQEIDVLDIQWLEPTGNELFKIEIVAESHIKQIYLFTHDGVESDLMQRNTYPEAPFLFEQEKASKHIFSWNKEELPAPRRIEIYGSNGRQILAHLQLSPESRPFLFNSKRKSKTSDR